MLTMRRLDVVTTAFGTVLLCCNILQCVFTSMIDEEVSDAGRSISMSCGWFREFPTIFVIDCIDATFASFMYRIGFGATTRPSLSTAISHPKVGSTVPPDTMAMWLPSLFLSKPKGFTTQG